MRPEVSDKQLEQAYEAILKSNEEADEHNYRLDFYRALMNRHLGGAGSDLVNKASWVALFKKYDHDNDQTLNFEEFKSMAKEVRIKDRKPSDVEVEMLARQINNTEHQGGIGEISEENWVRWILYMEGKKERTLIFLEQARDLKNMPMNTA